jgi:hypothetical protein
LRIRYLKFICGQYCRKLKRHLAGEAGFALPIVLAVLALGILVTSPFLTHASTNLISSQNYRQTIDESYAADAGLEHAIWSLAEGNLASQIPAIGNSTSYTLPYPVNTITPLIIATKTAGLQEEVPAGTITKVVIDNLQLDTTSYTPRIIKIVSGVYAAIYRSSTNSIILKTVGIADSGTVTNTNIDSLVLDATSYEPDIIYVSGNTYAIAYRGTGSDGFLKTVSIAGDGNIGNTVIDTLEFDTANGFEPSIIHVTGNIYAIAYRGTNSDGFLITASIASDGNIGNAVIDTLEFDTADGNTPDIIYVAGNIYAVVYRGTGSDGFLKTVSIASDGNIGNAEIDTLEFDTADCYEPDILYVSDDVYAIAYRGTGNDGFLISLEIAPSGFINHTSLDTYEYDTLNGYEPNIIKLSGSTYAIAYRGGTGLIGYIKTIQIATSTPDTYQIQSNAGDTTTTAVVIIDNGQSTVTSWILDR